MANETLLLLTIIIPIVGIVFIVFFNKSPNLREASTLITAGLLFLINIFLTLSILNNDISSTIVISKFLPGAELKLTAEPLAAIFGMIASGLWIVTSIYSIGYMRGKKESNQTRFYSFFALAISATMGVAYSGNLITLFIFYEILSLSTYPLVTHHQTEQAKKGGRTYLGVLLSTSIVFFLFAIVWIWSLTGTTEFVPGGILNGKASPFITSLLMILFIFGIGKAGVMPFHRWLPAAMVAPTPVSALLHAVAVVKAGVFSILKIVIFIFGLDNLSDTNATEYIIYITAATIIIASIVALKQDNLKKMLAYSTVSQLSYIVLAAMLANKPGAIGGALHIASHAFGKITLFFCAGAIYVASGKTTISQLSGIGKSMPWTMTAFAIGAISIIGLPPTGGFISKWYILLGAVESKEFILLAVLIISTLLSAAYLLPVIYSAFFQEESSNTISHGEAPIPILIALYTSVFLTFGMFVFPNILLRLVNAIGISL
ncbi:proton-conducting transporter membrane subunit [Alphaproteobacteria bacterium]|nr:proton-conducting transporter membrane subunit [Alphaproteobacteria bacterium]